MEIIQIPLNLVIPSPMNPRKTFDEGELKELADNIEKQGLLQPITVRPVRHPNNEYGDRPDKYEIVCGERRFRAMSLLFDRWNVLDLVAPEGYSYNRFTKIPAIVREMSDEEAFDAMITENLQRKDVDPIEEAFAFGQLVKTGKTIEEIAARFGKSIRFVQDRIKLNSLIPEFMIAVKDGKMAITAAMIICKLDEDMQKRFLTSYKYQGYTKFTALVFCQNVFRDLERVPWSNKYTGGCGITCEQCEFNTSNHGCLFWEMKSTGKGRCSNQERFIGKSIAYVLDKIKKHKKELVAAGQPLECGKMVVIESDGTFNADRKQLNDKVYGAIRAEGVEVVKYDSVFESRCFYDKTDERLQKKLELNQVYKCLRVIPYGNIAPEIEYHYIKGRSGCSDSESPIEGSVSSQSVEAMGLVADRKRILSNSNTKFGEEYRKLAKTTHVDRKKGPLSDNEQLAFACLIFSECSQEVREKYGDEGGYMTRDASMVETVKQNIQDLPMWIRDYMKERMTATDVEFYSFHRHIARKLFEEWKPKEIKAIGEKIIKSVDRRLAKIDARLKELGYDRNGQLLPESKTEPAPAENEQTDDRLGMLKNLEEMKKKHPDAIIIFRVGDFYECLNDDADTVAEVLSITVTNTNKGYRIAGFPHHALDTYLPKLVSAGKRVAICENLKPPKK